MRPALLSLLLPLALPIHANAGKYEVIFEGPSSSIRGHVHLGQAATFRGYDAGAVSDTLDEASWATFTASTSQADCDAAMPWGAFYSSRDPAIQAELCDLARGLGPYVVRLRVHLELAYLDAVSPGLSPSEWAALQSAASTSAPAFDASASALLGDWWAERDSAQRQGLREAVLAW